MIVQKQFLNKLKDFGVNSYEAKLWTALLSRGVATAGELSDIANVPRSRSYDVLESLERKGFVIMKLGKPIKYIAVPPSEVIERVKKHVQDEASQQQKVLEELRASDVLSELTSLHKQGADLLDPSELTGVLKGRTNIYHHLNSLIKGAEQSVLLMTTEQGLGRKAEQFKAVLQKAKDRGVRVKILGPTARNQSAVKLLSAFAQTKHAEVPTRMCIVDGTHVLMMSADETNPNYDFGIWASIPSFAQAFEKSFHANWERNE